jgi:raffinose synthase
MQLVGLIVCCAYSGLRAVSENLVLRIESGDQAVTASDFPSILLLASGTSLFNLISESVTHAARLSGEAKPLAEKQMPKSLNYFGWCTWDAFYSTVSAQVCCLSAS